MKTPQYTREIPQRYRLEAAKCKQCGKLFFPPRLICDECKSREFENISLKPEGTILSHTVVHTPSKMFNLEAPFVVAIVETIDGGRLTCQVVDCDPHEVKIGSKVEIVFRKVQQESAADILCYGYKAVLMR